MSKTYSELNQELQEVLSQLEAGELDIDKAVTLYERGLKIIADLEKQLKTAEHTVSRLRQQYAADATQAATE